MDLKWEYVFFFPFKPCYFLLGMFDFHRKEVKKHKSDNSGKCIRKQQTQKTNKIDTMDFSFSTPPDFHSVSPSFDQSSSSLAAGFDNADFFGNAAASSSGAANNLSSDAFLGGNFMDLPPPPVAGGTQFDFVDSLMGTGAGSINNVGSEVDAGSGMNPGIARLDTSDAIRGNLYASANHAGLGNGTTEKDNLKRQFVRQRMLGRLGRWQQLGLLDNCLVEDHDFSNKDLIRGYTFEYVTEIFTYYRMRKDTQMYTDLLTTTFRETASNMENYLVKQHDYRSCQGITNKIEEDYELYRDDFEEYGEMLSEINMPTYVLSGMRFMKTIAGVIASNAALSNMKTTPRRLRAAMAINPNLEKEFYKTHLDVMTNASSAGRAAKIASEQYEEAVAEEEGGGAPAFQSAPKRRRTMMSLADRMAIREEEDRNLANLLHRQPAPDAPRPPPAIDTRSLDPSEDPALPTRAPMRGLQEMEREMADFENQIDVDGIFASTRNNATHLDFHL